MNSRLSHFSRGAQTLRSVLSDVVYLLDLLAIHYSLFFESCLYNILGRTTAGLVYECQWLMLYYLLLSLLSTVAIYLHWADKACILLYILQQILDFISIQYWYFMGCAITAPTNQPSSQCVSAYIWKQLRNLGGMWNVYRLILQIRAIYCRVNCSAEYG